MVSDSRGVAHVNELEQLSLSDIPTTMPRQTSFQTIPQQPRRVPFSRLVIKIKTPKSTVNPSSDRKKYVIDRMYGRLFRHPIPHPLSSTQPQVTEDLFLIEKNAL